MKRVSLLISRFCKVTVVSVLSGLILSTFVEASTDWIRPEVLNIVPENFFVPTPFDSSKDVEILISGNFMNSCFRAGPASAQVDAQNKRIYLSNQVYFYESSWCLQVIKRYAHTIHLGALLPGRYEVITWDNHGQEHLLGGLSVYLSSELN